MTPERIAEIFAEETGFDIDASDSALRDFAMAIYLEGVKEEQAASANWHKGWAAGFACAALTSLFSLMFYFVWMQYGPQFIEWIQYGHHNW